LNPHPPGVGCSINSNGGKLSDPITPYEGERAIGETVLDQEIASFEQLFANVGGIAGSKVFREGDLVIVKLSDGSWQNDCKINQVAEGSNIGTRRRVECDKTIQNVGVSEIK